MAAQMSPSRKRKIRLAMLANYPRCHWCGSRLTPADATLDHWIPRSRGGTNHQGNLRLSCCGCNMAKSDMLPAEFWRALERGDVWLGAEYWRRRRAARRRSLATA